MTPRSPQPLSPPQTRYPLLDVLRGLTLLSMIAYHAAWDLVYLYGADWPWYHSTPGFLWQQSICWSFIFLSGFCASLGRRTLRRGAVVLAASVLVSAVTLIGTPESAIRFGVLTLLGSAMLLVALLRPLLERCPSGLGLAGSLLAFLLARNVNRGVLSLGRLTLATLPRDWYRNLMTTYLGFPMPGFVSSDYFSLLPWFCLFLAGFYTCRLLAARSLLDRLPQVQLPPLALLGRHSLGIYLLHQPVLYGGMMLLHALT